VDSLRSIVLAITAVFVGIVVALVVQAWLDAPAASPAASDGPVAPAPREPVAAEVAEDLPSDLPPLRCVSPGQCVWPRTAMQRLRDDPSALARRVARAMPYTRAGGRVGYKLFGIKPGRPAAELGLHNGDVAVAVNDHRLATETGVRAAHEALLAADELRIDVERKGEPVRVVLRLE
jgi:membrane-associated protease RseP (regulator of RpoE activity)